MDELSLITLAAAKSYTDEHGGGGGGTSNYNDLSNKPQIGGNTLVGNKTASDLGLVAAETGKGLSANDYTDEDKAIVGGVTAALAGKQGALTAGDHISINASNEISVNRELTPHQTSYRIKGTGRDTMNITKYIDGVQESSTDYTYSQGTTRTIDDAFTINDTYSSAGYIWQFVWLKDSTTHDKDYTVEYRSYEGAFDFTEVFNDEDLSGYKLIIKSEMDTALSGKQDTLTFDDVPTDNSNNPVKSNGIYDALALKQNATDNNLQTTDKTVVGAVNELKSGLTNYEIRNNTNLEVPDRVNLFDKDNLDVVLKYYDGTEWKNQSQGQWETVFIPVIGGATYTLSGFPAQGGVQSVFTASDITTVLSKFASSSNNQTHTAPENAAYIGLGVYEPNASFTSAQMELGTTATAYAPYIPSVESRIEAVEINLLYLGKGTHDFKKTVYCGYISGSGNYLDFFVPCKYDNTISTVTLNNSAIMSIYTFNGALLTQGYIDFTVVSLEKTIGGLRIELKFNNTQTTYINTIANIAFGNDSVFTFA